MKAGNDDDQDQDDEKNWEAGERILREEVRQAKVRAL